MSIVTVSYLQNFRGNAFSEDRALAQDAAGAGISELGDLHLYSMRKLSKYVWTFKLEEGTIIVPETGGRGAYICRFEDATTITAPRVPNNDERERLDIIVARVYDSGYGGGRDEAVIEYITGISVRTENMATRAGAPGLPQNSVILYDVSQRGDRSIRVMDRRPVAGNAARANVGGTKYSMVTSGNLHSGSAPLAPIALKVAFAQHTALDRQVAYAINLGTGHRKGAFINPFLRWGYVQGTTALTGNYRVALYDAAGKRLCYTKQTAFRGSANQKIDELLQWETGNTPSAELLRGVYYIGWNVDCTNAGHINIPNAVILPVTANKFTTGLPNILLDKAYASITPPVDLSGYTDAVTGGVVAPAANECAPMFVWDAEARGE